MSDLKIPYVNLKAQWETEKSELMPIIESVLASGNYVLEIWSDDRKYKHVQQFVKSK